jgi:hypothetical protein
MFYVFKARIEIKIRILKVFNFTVNLACFRLNAFQILSTKNIYSLSVHVQASSTLFFDDMSFDAMS